MLRFVVRGLAFVVFGLLCLVCCVVRCSLCAFVCCAL